MMKNHNTGIWLKVVIAFSESPKEKIICPVCKEEFLTVTTVEESGKVYDVYLHCNKCKARTVITVAKAHQEKIFKILHNGNSKA